MNLKHCPPLYVFLSAASLSTQAALIDPLSISAASGCGSSSTTCTVDWNTSFETTQLAGVEVTRSTGTSWLIRYNLHSPSAFTSNYDYYYTGEYTTSITPYTGNIWLEAPAYLNTDSTNRFNVYTDQVDQNPGMPGYELSIPNFNFDMTTDDVLSGSASFAYTTDGSSPGTSTGSLIVNNFSELITCIECSFDVSLNLVGIQYFRGQLWAFPELQSNAQLLSYGDNFLDYNYKDREFFVSSVPVPAAAWLFSSGFLALVGLIGKSKKKN